jgi:toxin YoeB
LVARSRDAVFDQQFLLDLAHFVVNDRKLALRLLDLVHAILRDPFGGIGKPEPLKRFGAGAWSRRLNDEHRLVYLVKHDRVIFLQARFHY